MAIKMRNNTNPNSVCCECGESRGSVLDMFDICVGNNSFTICDACNEALLFKTLKAECLKNERTKTQYDMVVINKRKAKVGFNFGGK
jgi:hypothetical protein